MKQLYSILVATLIVATIFAESPEKISHQAVIRNSTNALLTNQNVGMQISILQGSENGTAVYIEKQQLTTNNNGLITIEIGSGNVISGSFSSIEWGA